MQRITHILYSGLGGHGSVVFSYLKEPLLSEYKHSLLFFGIEEITAEYKKLCEERNIDYTFIRKTSFLKPGYVFKLLSKLKAGKSSVLLVHSLPTVPVLIIFSLFGKSKIILVEHASLQLKRGVDYIWTALSHLFFHRVVYLTQAALLEVKNKFRPIFKLRKSRVISNGIDLNRFIPDAYSKSDTCILAIHCRLVEVKDLETLIKAISVLKNKVPIKLKIAGDGPVKETLKSLANNLNVLEDITFCGLLNEEEIIDFLKNTDIYVNTSKIESMSTSLMQAMACGLPCIVSDIKGNMDMIANGVNGLYFELSNHEDLAAKIKGLCNNWERRRQLGEMARNWAEDNLSNEVLVTNYQKLIRELL